MSTAALPVRIFIAYSSKDLAFKDEIRRRLKPLLRAGKISIWDNYNIEGGGDWDADIRNKLGQADLILLLLSPDALDSDYFYEVEAPIALRRHQAGEAIAVGVLLRPCHLKYTPFEELERYELLPKKGYPITDPHWHHADAAYLTIFEEIDILVEKVEALRAARALHLQHQGEYTDFAAEANALVEEKKWTEAKIVLDNALTIWEEGFVPVREELEKQRKKCSEELKAAAAVQKKIREAEERRRREATDQADWQIAERSNTETAYQKYLTQYPNGRYLVQAKQKMATYEQSREDAARKKREREAAEAHAQEMAERKKREAEEAACLATEAQGAKGADSFADLMISIKGGSFEMGDIFGDGTSWEKPVHRVTVPDFHLCKYPVTQAQWKTIMDKNPSNFQGAENLPVEQVSWNDAQIFIKKLNEKTEKKYRLPSEAEWEYAAREGGKKVRFGNGKDMANPQEINFDGRRVSKKYYSEVGEYRQKTTPVNAFAPNALGLHDMSGNVLEWCQDIWHEDYTGAPDDGSVWKQGIEGSLYVARGGAWNTISYSCRVAARSSYMAAYRYKPFGFRLAR